MRYLLLSNVEEVLRMGVVEKWNKKVLAPEESLDNTNILLRTIKVPNSLLYLTDKLPRPRYNLMNEVNQKAVVNRRHRSNERNGPLLPLIHSQKSTNGRNVKINKNEMIIESHICKNNDTLSAETSKRQNMLIVIKNKSKPILRSNKKLKQSLILAQGYMSNEQSRNDSVVKSVEFTNRKLQEIPIERNNLIKNRARQRIKQLLKISKSKANQLPLQYKVQQLINRNKQSPTHKTSENCNKFITMRKVFPCSPIKIRGSPK